jgi:hypothetical protein
MKGNIVKRAIVIKAKYNDVHITGNPHSLSSFIKSLSFEHPQSKFELSIPITGIAVIVISIIHAKIPNNFFLILFSSP